MELDNTLVELNANEKKWWEQVIKDFRARCIKEPKHYSDFIIKHNKITPRQLQEDIDSVIESLREKTWQLYLVDEAVFNRKVLAYLVKERDFPRESLTSLLENRFQNEIKANVTDLEFSQNIAEVVGEFTGVIMPYVYALGLSTTNSRRSRSGKTFESIIESVMDVYDYPYETQSSVGTDTFSKSGLGKKVDLIVPGVGEYLRNRSKSAVVTVKTSLRERWQEVAEELQRTNVPHIYLLTADKSVTGNVIDIMKNYNITLVVYSSEKQSKFSDKETVIDFQTFYNNEMKHMMSYWSK